MMRWTWRWLVWLVLLPAGMMINIPVMAQETVTTEDGTFAVWQRPFAKEADLMMPFCAGLLIDSAVYRVRDRKKRDILCYAVAHISTTQKIDEIAAQYRRALGPAVQSDTVDGVITICDGTRDDCRVVTLTPQPAFCRVTLTRVQRYTIPPRVYTDREQQVLRVLNDATALYQAAGRITYHFEQTVTTTATEKDAAPQAPPVLQWDIEFIRPDKLRATATLNGTAGLTITTQDGKLLIARPGQPDETRPITLPLTLTQVPELEGDIVAHLMLGENLVTKLVDYLALLPLDGQPLSRQAQIVLTYPENKATLHLEMDMTRKMVQRSVVVIDDNEQHAQIVRTYRDVVLEPAADAATAP